MKKLVAMIVAVMVMLGCVSAFAAGKTISQDEAKQIALDYAGLKADQVRFTKCHLDLDDGRQVYEIEFFCGNVEYDMDIDIHTGRVYEADRDYEGRFGLDDHDWDDHDGFEWDDIFDD